MSLPFASSIWTLWSVDDGLSKEIVSSPAGAVISVFVKASWLGSAAILTVPPLAAAGGIALPVAEVPAAAVELESPPHAESASARAVTATAAMPIGSFLSISVSFVLGVRRRSGHAGPACKRTLVVGPAPAGRAAAFSGRSAFRSDWVDRR